MQVVMYNGHKMVVVVTIFHCIYVSILYSFQNIISYLPKIKEVT